MTKNPLSDFNYSFIGLGALLTWTKHSQTKTDPQKAFVGRAKSVLTNLFLNYQLLGSNSDRGINKGQPTAYHHPNTQA